jgi:4-hydroxy-L-threonine phosphate dehydrogenase PdxA
VAASTARSTAWSTGPVHKASINAGGIAYTGTTELLAEQAGARW